MRKKDLCYLDAHPHICHTQLTLKFNTAWDNEPIYSNYTRSAGSLTVRYVLEFWTMSDDGKLETQLERKIVNGGSLAEGNNRYQVSVDLPADRIAVLAWAEPLASGQTSNPYFDVSSLTSVKMKEPFGREPPKMLSVQALPGITADTADLTHTPMTSTSRKNWNCYVPSAHIP